MARPRNPITWDQHPHVVAYLDRKLAEEGHPGWRRYQAVKETPPALTRWCEANLDTTQWNAIQALVRKRRNQERAVTVTLSRSAHRKLKTLADSHNVTLSRLIETSDIDPRAT